MKQEFASIAQTPRDIRHFGFVVGFIFALVGFYGAWRGGGGAPPYLVGIGAALVTAALMAPRVLRPLYIAWMSLGIVLGFVTSRIILIVLFYLVVVPLAAMMRLFSRKYKPVKFQSPQTSYWRARTSQKIEKPDLEKQF